jgi:hypothetical protein
MTRGPKHSFQPGVRPPVSLGVLAVTAALAASLATSVAAPKSAAAHFRKSIQPVLNKYCSDCHEDGMHKGNVSFDELGADADLVANQALWSKVLKNVRAGLMPPENKDRPDPAERQRLEAWIKYEAFGIDPKNPDPGRVTVRRLNRIEYRNTVQDLMGVEFDTETEFPQDDSGYGFDNIGDVLTVSPMLLEKYFAAAQTIVDRAVLQDEKHHDRFFPKTIPSDAVARRVYASELLGRFAGKAFRRPVDHQTVERLTNLAEAVYSQPNKTFEAGVAHAMVAVLASPRFIFREEANLSARRKAGYPLIDEFSLASRLSYFLWSSMPDDQLFDLAAAGQLRAHLDEQVARLLADKKSQAFIRNFTGQWLQARDIDTVIIEAKAVLQREEKPDPEHERKRARFRQLRNQHEKDLTADEKDELAKLRADLFQGAEKPPRVELTAELRRAMRHETEQYFEYIVRQDRPVLELIDSDYTFANERLAKHYGLPDISGDEIRLVKLPADSSRGGILTQGTVLAVTSNPTRTSPVKRGLFILDNVLGTPPPPPPPNIPPLEDAAKGHKGGELSLRENLALHRSQPLCHSCHNRLDPLGLAFENFNALGMWRDQERELPIDSTGRLVTGETFSSVRELKHVLVSNHSRDFYRCLTEKLMTYAIGRGLEYSDVETVDLIVDRLENGGGQFSAVLHGVVDSAPFQRARAPDTFAKADLGR